MTTTISCNTSDSNSGSMQQLDVKMTLSNTNNTASKQFSTSPGVQSVDSLTEVKLLVEELELESTADKDSLNFEVDDFIVNLPLDGTAFNLVSADVPAGVYDEFEMEIEYDDDTNVNDSDFIHESGDDDDGYAIVIKGFYNGDKFIYQSNEDFELELEFNHPFEINDDSSPSIVINIDPVEWFKDSSSNALDPNNAGNREQIDDNIKNSFDVEENDDDKDDENEDD